MVKVKNVFGDEYKGRQGNAVYQKFYGRQVRRLWDGKKKNNAPGQVEQKQRFKIGLSFWSSLTREQREFLGEYVAAHYDGLTAQQWALKVALSRPRAVLKAEQIKANILEWRQDWDAEGWPYRQTITITNNTASDLTDFQVKIELTADNVGANFNWNSGGADLRFYDESGTKLPYWVESWDSVNKTATVWVKVGLIPASGTATVKMYYGNTAAQSESNAEAVFDFYDDFNDLSKWELYAGNPGRIENGWLVITNQTTSVYLASAQITTSAVIECYGFDEVLNSDMDLQVGIADTVKGKRWTATLNLLDDLGIVRSSITGTSFETSVLANIGKQQAPVIGVLSLIKKGNTLKAAFTRSDGAHWETGELVETLYNPNNASYVMIGVVSGSADTIKYDWVRVRKYADVEPSAVLGAEEIGYNWVEGVKTIYVKAIEHVALKKVELYDSNNQLIRTYDDISNLDEGRITTIWRIPDDVADSTVKAVVYSLAGTVDIVNF